MTTPFYADWTFWTAVVALLALVLSQLPPLYTLFRAAALDVEAFDRIHVSHVLGQPTATLHLILTNSGGREAKIKSMSLAFTHDGDTFELPGRGYYQSPVDQSAVILTSFRLPSNGEWKHIANFFTLPPRADEREIDQIKSAIRNNILPRKSEPGNENILIEAPPQLVAPALDFFHRKFRWHPGEYEVTAKIRAEPSSADIERRYRFTIFESDTAQLVGETERYRYGAGVYFNDSEQRPVFLPLMPVG